MQLQSIRLFQAGDLPKEAIPYSSDALRQDLERLRNAWEDVQCSRDRNAIYGYLSAVYGLVAWWAAEGRDLDRGRRAVRLRALRSPKEKTRSPPLFGAPPTRPRPTNQLGASGPAYCATPPSTS
jgi:hypothetical protein